MVYFRVSASGREKSLHNPDIADIGFLVPGSRTGSTGVCTFKQTLRLGDINMQDLILQCRWQRNVNMVAVSTPHEIGLQAQHRVKFPPTLHQAALQEKCEDMSHLQAGPRTQLLITSCKNGERKSENLQVIVTEWTRKHSALLVDDFSLRVAWRESFFGLLVPEPGFGVRRLLAVLQLLWCQHPIS